MFIPKREIWTRQPQYPVLVKPAYAKNLLSVYNAVGVSLPVSPVDGSGFGLPSGMRSDLASKYTLHGYNVNGLSEPTVKYDGQVGKYLSYDGAISRSHNTAHPKWSDTPTTPFTFLMLVRFNDATNNQLLAGFITGFYTAPFYGVGFTIAGATLNLIGAYNDTHCITTPTPSLGVWHVLAGRTCTTDGGIFLDGAKVASGNVYPTSGQSAGYYMTIGMSGNSAIVSSVLNLFNGDVGLMATWNRGLSDAELIDLTSGISAPWKMFQP